MSALLKYNSFICLKNKYKIHEFAIPPNSAVANCIWCILKANIIITGLSSSNIENKNDNFSSEAIIK